MLRVVFAEDAESDLHLQAEYYAFKVTRVLADEYVAAVQKTVRLLRQQPGIGRPRSFRHATLQNLRVWRVAHPFERMLVYYRIEDNALIVFRIIAADRDLPRASSIRRARSDT